MAGWKVRTPPGNIANMGRLDSIGRLWICQPLSPSQNVLARTHWAAMGRYRVACYNATLAQARSELGGYPWPWTEHAMVSIYRCALTAHRVDTANIIGGAKHAIDVLLDRRSAGHIGAGLLADDDEDHMRIGVVENRGPKQWARGGIELYGPATWLVIRPMGAWK